MEKVLHGLSSCGNDYGTPNICEVTECPYRETEVACVHGLAHDAMMLISELLKAQESVEPIEIIDYTKDVKDYNRTLKWKCGACGQELVGDDVFCRNCGRAVKWDG